jgi:hypothetical protein
VRRFVSFAVNPAGGGTDFHRHLSEFIFLGHNRTSRKINRTEEEWQISCATRNNANSVDRPHIRVSQLAIRGFT